MHAFTRHSAWGCKALRISLASVLIASAGMAAASGGRPDGHATPATHYYGLYEHRAVMVEPASIDRPGLDPAGTVGRMDLGESPFYPEGPGNVAD
ncbi:hypothetical protein Msil_2262 [Methylocella silvestris BL2]|uniref:Uncharacterized protein n=1 Tax=Methylocella silvestris (strain DSM 15510 / CIP 108128 / LMG 27833 / NCIMB 13906 / BL2) TaxID=395965 RepID=B8ET58_METSB|nr:hypothetical protein [Methylocella silvestris]ACK51196.1 hypothetical protein Msil_2262 [Methylocella silvestris BL2]